jgi:predicted Zn-dependent peptidase
MFKVKKHELSNGLKVVLVHMPGSSTTTVEVRVETGSKYESSKELGLSHFLEHMCFKGTNKRPSAAEVHKAFDELGAISNAFTSTEVTGYWAKASYKHVLKILDIVSDIYLNTIFQKEDLAKEKGVIIEEINMYEDRPQSMVGELFDIAMHGNQPAGLPIIGNKKSVNSFTVEDLYNYRSKHYVAKATTVIVSGQFEENKVMAVVKNLFGEAPRGKKFGKKKTKILNRGARVVHKYKDTDQAHIILGMRSYSYKDKRNRVVGLIRGILSGGMSSRLFHRLREELGICYYVTTINVPSTDHGEFGVASGVDPKRIEVAIDAIMDEFRKLKKDLISEDELKKVKTSMISKMYMSLETSDNVLDYFSNRSTFYDDLKTPSEIEKEILKVRPEDVRNMARELFTNKDLLLAVVSKKVNKPKLKKLLKF